MRKILTRLVSLARGSIAVAALVATILSFALPAKAEDFNLSTSYIIDARACTWVENQGSVMRISEDNGSTWINPSRIITGVYLYTPTKQINTITIGRTDDNNNFINYTCPSGKKDFPYITISSDYKLISSHAPVRVAGAFITKSNWGSDPKSMSWDNNKRVFTYETTSDGNCMVSTNENFWNGRLKLIGSSNVIPSSKPTDANLQTSTSTSGDLNLPASGTIYFEPWNNKIWYEPTLYVFSNNSGSWNNTSGGRKVTVGQPIVFTSTKPIEFVFGHTSTYTNINDDKTRLYGARLTTEVTDGQTRRAASGENRTFKIGSGQWEVTVPENGYMPNEYVAFSVERKGDAPTTDDSYVEYKIVDDKGNNLCTLQWDGTRGVYEGQLPSVAKGTQVWVWARKINADAAGADKFGKTTGDGSFQWWIQAGANRTNIFNGENALYINCSNPHNIVLTVKEGRYSEPSQIAFEEEIFPDKADKVYLRGRFLNDSYDSPAWEFKKQADGSYFLDDFAMRKNPSIDDENDFSHIEIVVYDSYGVPEVKKVTRKGFTIPRESYDRQPGRLCTATLNAAMSEVTITEKMREDAKSSELPYIGIIGKQFRQSHNYQTRHVYEKDGVERMGHTNDGWQEAYIEYGQFGSPLLDSNGYAYYNTVWPPRYNILMQSHIGADVDPLNISSDDLRLRVDAVNGIMTGRDWITTLGKTSDEYTAGTGNTQQTDNTGLCLEADRTYVRYVVDNVWMMGEYKIWTGFAGRKNDSWGADWNNFLYWGPGGNDDTQADNKRKQVNHTYIINGEQNNFYTEPTDKVGNVQNYAREYYSTMELFIPVTVTDEKEGKYEHLFSYDLGKEARFYMTKAAGGAQIDAVARDNKLVGFAPKLNGLDNTGYHVTEYKVTRYAYDANAARKEWLPCDKNRHQVSEAQAVVASGESHDSSIASNKAFNDLFEKNFPVKLEDLTTADKVYTDDKTTPNQDGSYREGYAPYAAGRYIFCLNVKFANAAGETKEATVWSPYVEIFEEQGDVHIYEAQLVELPGGKGNDLLPGYTYVTYQPERTRFSHVAVQVDDDGQPIELTRQVSDDMIEKLHKVYVELGKWTNKTLLLTEDPEQFIGDKTVFEINRVGESGEKTEVKNLISSETNRVRKIRNWYAYIEDNGAAVEKPITYEVNFEGTLAGTAGSGTETSTLKHSNQTVYRPWFMRPWLGKPVMEVVAETEAQDVFPGSYTATHEHLDNGAGDESARQQEGMASTHHELRVTIPIVMPNVLEASGLKNAVYGALSIAINGESAEAVDDAKEYKLVYRHQNPYDWMSYNGSGWTAVERTWNMVSDYSESTAIRGVTADEYNVPVVASFEPNFSVPDVSVDDIDFNAEVTEDKDKGAGHYKYTAMIRSFKNAISAPWDAILGTELNGSMQEDEHHTYLCRTRGDDGDADNKYYGKVLNCYTGGSHLLGEFYYTDPKGSWTVEAQEKVMNWLKTLRIDFGRAYYFYTGENGDGSGYEGFRWTNLPQPTESTATSPDRAAAVDATATPSHEGVSTTLVNGDNAYLLVPAYATINLGDDGVNVSVENIGVDVTGIETGRGYIDLLGNEGSIYAADGRMVYTGSARAELTQGVYMVTLRDRTVKVLVK